MDKTPGGPREPLDLEEILREFAPEKSPSQGGAVRPSAGGPAPREEGSQPPKPAGKPPEGKGERTPEKAAEKPLSRPVKAPSGDRKDREGEEPTLRLVSRDGKPVGVAEALFRPSAKRAEEPVGKTEEPVGKTEEPSGKRKKPWWKRRRRAVHVSEKVIQFPGEDNSVPGRIGRLMEKADRYAENMFPDDGEPDPEREAMEQLLPGVDYEDEPTHAPAPRRARRVRRPKPDLPPKELAKRYKRGLAFLHTRTYLAFFLALLQVYLMIYRDMGLPMIPALTQGALPYQAAAGGLILSALLGIDLLARGLLGLLKLRPEGETLLLFAVPAAVLDALTMPTLGDRGGSMPYCGVVAAAVFFALWGKFKKLRGLRYTCRAADSAAEPYVVTLDEKAWNGADAYMKWSGEITGYGSQLQEDDGAQRAYHGAAPILLAASFLLALIASVGQRRPELFFWSLSACLTAACGFTCFLTFSMPFHALAKRLFKVGAGLGGWEAVRWTGKRQGVVLTDGDLFPPGSVTLNGIKLTGQMSMETAVSYTASMIRETGSALEKPFQDLLRTQNNIYRKCAQVVCHEGGVTGTIGAQQVCVGSAAFMEIMHIGLPGGLKVKSAVFLAVNGTLEAIFAINYRLHPAIRPALEQLVSNHLDPILATRDFLIIPDMLRQKFKLPVEKMEFPSLDRRRELSSLRQDHAKELFAVLCREGLGPYAEAAVAGKRLTGATRTGLFFSLLGSSLGLLLAFYLTRAAAYAALGPGSLLAFLLLWLVPAFLVSGWATRY